MQHYNFTLALLPSLAILSYRELIEGYSVTREATKEQVMVIINYSYFMNYLYAFRILEQLSTIGEVNRMR